jgi:hypothetical protein
VQRVRLRFHIGPLDSTEMREYINHRLAVAGRADRKLFHDDTLDIIYRYTGGVPRLINTLCDTALLCAAVDGKMAVTVDELQVAIAELEWEEHESTTGRHRKLEQLSARLVDDSMLTQIEIRSDGEQVALHTYPLGRIIVGRSPDNEIYLRSKFVSRHHAQIVTDEEGCIVEDLNSTNGVYLGEKQIKKYRLRDGDVVTIGDHELIYTDLRKRESANEGAITDVLDAEEDGVVVGK